MVGVILCLHGATKISHRAQGIASVASRWHALVTCGPGDVSQPRYPNGNADATSRLSTMASTYSESDLESLDIVITMPTTTQLASYMSSYHKREAFGKKLRHSSSNQPSMHFLNTINNLLNSILKTFTYNAVTYDFKLVSMVQSCICI